MYEVKYFMGSNAVSTTLKYQRFVQENKIDIISVIALEGIIVLTYRERNAKLAN